MPVVEPHFLEALDVMDGQFGLRSLAHAASLHKYANPRNRPLAKLLSHLGPLLPLSLPPSRPSSLVINLLDTSPLDASLQLSAEKSTFVLHFFPQKRAGARERART